MRAAKCLFIFYNSFSLQLTENFHKKKDYLHFFVYIIFALKCIIKKKYLSLYSPLKGTIPVVNKFVYYTFLCNYA